MKNLSILLKCCIYKYIKIGRQIQYLKEIAQKGVRKGVQKDLLK